MWKRQLAFALVICLACVLLSGCAEQQTNYPEAGTNQTQPQTVRQQDVYQTATEAPAPVVEFPDDYDPQAEEEDEDEPAEEPGSTTAASDQVISKYAGSTPIPIDPVDMPTPTPKPDVTFEYETYDIKMGYSLDAPTGWEVVQDDANTFILRDPVMRDNVKGQIMLTAQTVPSTYRANDLRSELSNQLTQLQRNYVQWRVWTPDSRALLGGSGVYNAYRGETYDGTAVRGIVHVALLDRKVVTLSFSAPADYNTSYQRVYNYVRGHIK